MPEKKTIKKAQKSKKQGKSASTQAGEFVKEEVHHIRKGKHGAKSAKQAVAIGLSKARQAGVNIPDKKGKKASNAGHIAKKKVSAKRSKAATKRLKSQPKSSASTKALSKQTKKAASKRTKASRHRSAVKAAHTRAHA